MSELRKCQCGTIVGKEEECCEGATPAASRDCSRAKSSMTPCLIRDGDMALADDGYCVGCGWQPASLVEGARPDTAPDAQLLWAGARGYDLKAPHWDDLDEATRKAVEHVVEMARVTATAILREAADELEAIYRQQYGDGGGGIHPALARKFDRDMSLVRELRAHAAQRPERQEGER